MEGVRMLLEALVYLALFLTGNLESVSPPPGADNVYHAVYIEGPTSLGIGFFDLPGRKYRVPMVGGPILRPSEERRRARVWVIWGQKTTKYGHRFEQQEYFRHEIPRKRP
jgi:hypothetical protein